ncbi:cupin domain-containing protein [Gordonia terrae]|uniref:cupin domain-containing protein n=1 Tax=Gordonia terrae TaxID=2055 RepID=UPI00200A7F8E|nr:cupin domain-containing protein [Gordonia terrae]UPW07670.1 cupin domain-containing protein [Gordonia terrae]
MSAAELPDWVRELDLQPHPEGGWYRQTWRSGVEIPRGVLPGEYTGDRAAGTAIYFVLMPGDESAWHTVRSSELWLHHRGAPVELDLGGDADEPGDPSTVLVGPDIESGQHPQALVPPGVWQRARPAGDEPALVSCIVVPGFDFEDFRLV